MDGVLTSTALPNLHPAVVHFPIALLIVAVAFELAAATGRATGAGRAATALWILGAAAAWVAVFTGERAADSLVGVPAAVQPHIGEHHDWAEWTARAFTAVALVRTASLLPALSRAASLLRVLAVTGGIAGWILLLGTADRGGALVYRHGLAVAGGSGDAPGSAGLAAPEAAPASEGPGGIADVELRVSGPTLLTLPGEFGDVEVRATLDLTAFRGRVGPACRIRDASSLAVFDVSTDGHAALVVRKGGESRTLDEGSFAAGEDARTLTLSSAGRHWKGLVNGATVVHGHEAPAGRGAVGIAADGEGVVRIRRLEAVPLDGPAPGTKE